MTNPKAQMPSKIQSPDVKAFWTLTFDITLKLKGPSNNVIPAKAGIQKPLTSLDSGVRRSDESVM